jgi:hypothetical protein
MIDQSLRDGLHDVLVLFDQRQRFLIAVLDESRDACGGAANEARDPARTSYVRLAMVAMAASPARECGYVLALFRASDAPTVLTADRCWS